MFENHSKNLSNCKEFSCKAKKLLRIWFQICIPDEQILGRKLIVFRCQISSTKTPTLLLPTPKNQSVEHFAPSNQHHHELIRSVLCNPYFGICHRRSFCRFMERRPIPKAKPQWLSVRQRSQLVQESLRDQCQLWVDHEYCQGGQYLHCHRKE